ncbi:MAG: Uma2 family endonuclease [Thermomicrobia bacterium]|nr:Uma2 family endonuclease [Thermomicrobia bacterium]MCA1723073.1 Uma2 family endonuclease [Thermomicrobia bacterium]
MAVTQRLMTAEELWDMPDMPGKQHELVRGELIEVPTLGAIHNVIAALLYRLIYASASEQRLGLVCGDNMGYVLSRGPDTVRIPDVSFVAWERVPGAGIPEGSWHLPPDLAVEVVSPSDQAEGVYDKAREYVESGVRIVWVLWPKRRAVSVHTRDEKTAELGPDDTLDSSDVLPGFTARVGDLFAIPARP